MSGNDRMYQGLDRGSWVRVIMEHISYQEVEKTLDFYEQNAGISTMVRSNAPAENAYCMIPKQKRLHTSFRTLSNTIYTLHNQFQHLSSSRLIFLKWLSPIFGQ
jgi:predicted RNA-binding Zn ribbon-like protein